MSDPNNTNKNGRNVAERVVITGTLTLLTPTHLGNGDADGMLDMPLSHDAAEGVPLLTGSSIAGALRNYLCLREYGYRNRNDEKRQSMAERLFGGSRGNDEGEQSPLIVDDARAIPIVSEIRDNVRIDPQTRTAQDKKKFDLELLPAGTSFNLRFELLIAEDDAREELLKVLALALSGFEKAEISLGTRKRRGFGRCVVKIWQVQTFTMKDSEGLLAWLAADLCDIGSEWGIQPTKTTTDTAANALVVAQTTPLDTDNRQHFKITARFSLASPILIRSEEPIPIASNGKWEYPDTTHLRSRRNGNGQTPVVSGTSLAGALRARAGRILKTLAPQEDQKERILDGIFGSNMDARPTKKYASRLVVKESEIDADERNWLVQQRVSIDRFTGGAYDTALFSEAPLTGGTVELEMTLQGKPPEGQDANADVGILLLLLKDLWTGDLPLGGTSSIGRGRLRGIEATLEDRFNASPRTWKITEEQGCITVRGGKSDELERYVEALRNLLNIT